jgi:hypothetical protein
MLCARELQLGIGTEHGFPVHGKTPMQVICGSVATLVVAWIYYGWRAYFQAYVQQQRLLADRVAHLLWAMAQLPE